MSGRGADTGAMSPTEPAPIPQHEPAVTLVADAFDAWFFAIPEELAVMRRALQEWLVEDCALEASAAAELVLAAHEAATEFVGQLNTVQPESSGFAFRGEHDLGGVTLTLVAPRDLRPVHSEEATWSRTIVRRLVDAADFAGCEGSTELRLRRQTR